MAHPSRTLGRILRNLIEAKRREEAHREWEKNLFLPMSHLIGPEGQESFVRQTNDPGQKK